MSIESVWWGVFPALIGVVLIVATVSIAVREATQSQWLLSLGTVILCGYALLVLWRIFFLRAWPTAIPHLLIAVGAMLCGLQVILRRHR
jgi:hypothetical protein